MARAEAKLSELTMQMKSTIQGHFQPTLAELRNRFDATITGVDAWADDVQDALSDIRERLPLQLQELRRAWQTHGQDLLTAHTRVVESGRNYEIEIQKAHAGAEDLLQTAVERRVSLQAGFDQSNELSIKVGEDVSNRLENWQQSIAQSIDQSTEHTQTIEQGLADLSGAFAQGVSEVVGQLGQATTTVTEHISETLDQLEAELEQLGADQHDFLMDQVATAVSADVTEVVSLVETFVEAGKEMHQLFEGNLGEVLDSVKQVNQIIDQIKPVIDQAKKIL